MRRFELVLAVCLTLALSSSGGNSRAEVAACPQGNQIMVLVLGITEGPDPIPQVLWEPVREVDPDKVLNPDGGLRGDGRPDIAFDAAGLPHVVWAYNNGTDYDIAHATWTGSAWSATEYLTASTENEIDPRVFIDDSAIYVVWWEEDSGDIYLTKKPHGPGAWEIPEVLDAGPGRRPSMVRYESSILIVAEEPHGQMTDIIFSSDDGGDLNFESETVESIGHVDPLNVILHTEGRVLWMDWKHSDAEFAYAVFDSGGWSAPTIVPWTDESWTGEEQVRLLIRAEVLSD